MSERPPLSNSQNLPRHVLEPPPRLTWKISQQNAHSPQPVLPHCRTRGSEPGRLEPTHAHGEHHNFATSSRPGRAAPWWADPRGRPHGGGAHYLVYTFAVMIRFLYKVGRS